MKELELTVSVKNNRLKERRLEMKLSQAEVAKRIGIGASNYSRLEGLRMSPFSKDINNRYWTSTAQKISDFFSVPEEELFPEMVTRITAPVSVKKVDSADICSLLSVRDVASRLLPSDVIEQQELTGLLDNAMQKLSPRERLVIARRLGLNGEEALTLKKVGKTLGLSQERVRVIETMAMRKIRYAVGTEPELRPLRDYRP
jgi:RNA polymerase sigma factor (sigma-70 family)